MLNGALTPPELKILLSDYFFYLQHDFFYKRFPEPFFYRCGRGGNECHRAIPERDRDECFRE